MLVRSNSGTWLEIYEYIENTSEALFEVNGVKKLAYGLNTTTNEVFQFVTKRWVLVGIKRDDAQVVPTVTQYTASDDLPEDASANDLAYVIEEDAVYQFIDDEWTELSTGLPPALFTADPTTLDLGTSPTGSIDVSSDRLAGFSVILSGDISSVASVSTPIGSIGASGPSAGQECTVTVTRTSGTTGQTYEGFIVLEDESGNTQNIEVSLDYPDNLRTVAFNQGAKYIWSMDTAGTSQPNYGDGGTKALTLTSARATTTQIGAEGRFPLTDSVNGRASASVEATSDMSIVVCVNLTSLTSPRAFFGGNNYGNNVNPGYMIINSSGHMGYSNQSLSGGVVVTETPSTGVWLLAITINSSGSVNMYARKVGGSLLTGTYARGAAVSGTDTYLLGGNGSNFYSALGDYYFFAVYDTVIDSTAFNTLYTSIA
jgi:hypothetical protein